MNNRDQSYQNGGDGRRNTQDNFEFGGGGDDESSRRLTAGKININKTDSRQSDFSSIRDTNTMSIRGTIKDPAAKGSEEQILQKFSSQVDNDQIRDDDIEELDKEEDRVTDLDEEHAADRKGFGRKDDDDDNEPKLYEGKSPLRRAWWISKVFFFWLNPLLSFSAKQKSLKLENYGKLRDRDRAYHQINKLGGVWYQKSAHNVTKNTLIFTIFSTYKWNLIYLMSCNFVSNLLMFFQPFFLYFIIAFIKDGENKVDQWGIHFYDFDTTDVDWMKWLTPQRQYGLSLGLFLLLSQLFKFIIDENVTFACQMFAAKSSNALIGLIYEKQTRIYPSNGAGFTSGQIINFVQTDANKMFFFAAQMAPVANIPFLLIVAIGLLFYFLGYSFFSGLAVFIISFYINGALARKSATYQRPYMACQDKRVSLTTEALNNIKMIKLYSWIGTIEEQIKQKRINELNIYKKRLYIGMLIVSSLYFFPASLQAICYTFYIGFGGTLSLGVGYVVLNVFNMIRDPIRMLPLFIGFAVEFAISMRRIQEFLLLDEINETIVDRSAISSGGPKPDLSFEIKPGSNFYWGLKKEKEEEEGKKKGGKKSKHQEILDKRKSGKKNAQKGEPLLKQQDTSPSKKSEREATVNDLVVLKDIGLKVRRGEFVCIIGDVGSGKSSLLSSILGDLQYLDNNFMRDYGHYKVADQAIRSKVKACSEKEYRQAPVILNESLSFVQQTPWIQNKTIKTNILFGEKYNEKRYRRTIKICELTRDLEILPAGDETEIGEKGINLSGGQKARVGLARAVYAERDLILLDDPISALDANVKKSIFQNVMLDHLRNKTRILVTHAIDFLALVDRVIVMNDGQIVLDGKFEDIQGDPYLVQLMEIHKAHQNEQQEVGDKNEQEIGAPVLGKDTIKLQMNVPDDRDDDNEMVDQQAHAESYMGSFIDKSLYKSQHQIKQSQMSSKPKKDIYIDKKSKEKQTKKLQKKGEITTNEQDEKIAVTFNSYYKFFTKFYGGLVFFVISISCMVGFILCKMGADYIVGNWAERDDQRSNFWFYAGLSLSFAVLQGMFVYFRALCIQLFGWAATKKLHEAMIRRVLQAPVNLYFDTTPIGRIINKFSKDLNQVEASFGWTFGTIYALVFSLLYTVIIAIISLPWIAFILPVIAIVSWAIIRQAKIAIRETVRIVSTTKSPLISYLGETISGSSTIRAFGKTEQFVKGNKEFLNNNIHAIQFQAGVSAWFGIRVDVFALFIMLCLTVVVVIGRKEDGSNAIILSMLMTSILTIQMTLISLLKLMMQIESFMVNVVRCMLLLEVPQEKARPGEQGVSNLLKGRDNWPETGDMEFRNVSLKYRPTTEIVLNRLSFKIKSGEKIGVVGRTGAGKSTICLAISRIVEIFEGQIFIDGVDIGQIKLEDLRSRITVIPQDPTMFTGTLRFNLDPEGKCSDHDILDLLNKAQLQNLLDNDPAGIDQEISENGSNLSSGERQLISICRAILRKSKVVILDEATANIDVITEQKIQLLINTQFVDATMVVIAHRINTIIQSDRVLVLSFGEIQEFDTPHNLMSDKRSEFSKLITELKKKEQDE